MFTAAQSFTIPMLRGEGFLTRGNNLRVSFSASATPVSLKGAGELVLSPAAFAQILGGGFISGGWTMPLGTGVGLNLPQADGSGRIEGGAFDAAVWKAYGGAALQFDLAALFPGAWNHVQLRVYQEIGYYAHTGAAEGVSWVFENDSGENRNGFKYRANYTLAYEMPDSPVLRTLALQAELYRKLYVETGAFGDDLPYWTFTGLANFQISRRFSLAAIVQLSLDRNFSDWRYRIDKREDRYYQYRDLLEDKPLSLNFYRFAGVFSFKLF
jgi:hypothetical protein